MSQELQARIIGRALYLRSIFLRIVRPSRSAGGVRNSIKLTGGNLGGLALALTFISPPRPPPKPGSKIGTQAIAPFWVPFDHFLSLLCTAVEPTLNPLQFPSNEIQKPIQPGGCELSPCTSPSLNYGSTITFIMAFCDLLGQRHFRDRHGSARCYGGRAFDSS